MKMCKKCDACQRLYRRNYWLFWRQKERYCVILKTTDLPQTACEQWRKKVIRYDLSQQRFDEVIADLAYIADHS